MSTSATDPKDAAATTTSPAANQTSPKGKGKATEDVRMNDENDNEEEDDEDDEDDDEDEEEEDEEVEEEMDEIDPSAIVGRRTRGKRVDYTSKEALEKAGLTGQEDDDEEMNED